MPSWTRGTRHPSASAGVSACVTKRTCSSTCGSRANGPTPGHTRSSNANGTSVTDMSDPDPSVPRVASPNLSTAAMGVRTDSDRVIPRKQVVSWALWDWATQPFNSVLLTFVFAPLYLVSANFLPPDVAAQNANDTLTC